jgi:hypothetical protein
MATRRRKVKESSRVSTSKFQNLVLRSLKLLLREHGYERYPEGTYEDILKALKLKKPVVEAK